MFVFLKHTDANNRCLSDDIQQSFVQIGPFVKEGISTYMYPDQA